ncbi:MAG: hypothetical protein ABJX32_03925 [Tateyamaria sp.]|uniref:hypothetical protein n=1 Tax=Tateyamaria sp. TaxID=1929288 RepID=UPI00329C980F
MSDEYEPQPAEWKMLHDGELRELARQDLPAAIQRLEELADAGAKVEAITALHIAVLCLKAETPKELRAPRGRPKGTRVTGPAVDERTERRRNEREREAKADWAKVIENVKKRLAEESGKTPY